MNGALLSIWTSPARGVCDWTSVHLLANRVVVESRGTIRVTGGAVEVTFASSVQSVSLDLSDIRFSDASRLKFTCFVSCRDHVVTLSIAPEQYLAGACLAVQTRGPVSLRLRDSTFADANLRLAGMHMVRNEACRRL